MSHSVQSAPDSNNLGESDGVLSTAIGLTLSSEPPLVELVPLPASAQFLNVIESVFSGMVRAIIHNSDYQSTNEAMDAIDRHFKEKNQNFLDNPKRAGHKIWGMERSSSEFSASNNCKDLAYR